MKIGDTVIVYDGEELGEIRSIFKDVRGEPIIKVFVYSLGKDCLFREYEIGFMVP